MGSQCSTCGDTDKATEHPVGGQEPASLRPATFNGSAKHPENVVTPEPVILHPTAEQTHPGQKSGLPASVPPSKYTSNFSGPQGQQGARTDNQAQPEVSIPNPYIPPQNDWQVASIQNEVNGKAFKAVKSMIKREAHHFGEYGPAQNKKTVKHRTTGRSFEGYVNQKDEPHGWGILVTEKGEVIEGHFENGIPTKHLRYFTSEGCISDGDMTYPELKLHGSGSMSKADGFKVTCNKWEKGVPVGEIIETDPQGKKVFQGFKTNGLKHGECEIVHANFSLKGNFKDDVPEGNMQKFYTDGKMYVGKVNKDSQEDGEGTLTFVDGRKFSGPFSKGLANGAGIFTTDTGKALPQTWKNGQRV